MGKGALTKIPDLQVKMTWESFNVHSKLLALFKCHTFSLSLFYIFVLCDLGEMLRQFTDQTVSRKYLKRLNFITRKSWHWHSPQSKQLWTTQWKKMGESIIHMDYIVPGNKKCQLQCSSDAVIFLFPYSIFQTHFFTHPLDGIFGCLTSHFENVKFYAQLSHTVSFLVRFLSI